MRKIHEEYIEAGAQIIRTNTFATNTVSLNMPWEAVQDNIRQGYRLAKDVVQTKAVAQKKDVTNINEVARAQELYVAADIGQIPFENQTNREKISQEYVEICRTFLEEGAEIFVFETFSDMEEIQDD